MVVISGLLGLINPLMMFWFLLLYGIYGAILTMTAFFQRTYIQNLKMGPMDILKVLAACVLESMLFRYVLAYVRATAFLSYHKHKRQWGVIKRDKVNTGKKVK